jgi:hypothetical protein
LECAHGSLGFGFIGLLLIFWQSGYREGITEGKESALQEGFDDGFATVGAPLGRELGYLRGAAAAALSCVLGGSHSSDHTFTNKDETVTDLRSIMRELALIRLADIAPPDLQAIAHAKEHNPDNGTLGVVDDDMAVSAEVSLDNAFRALSTRAEDADGINRVLQLKSRLNTVLTHIGMGPIAS